MSRATVKSVWQRRLLGFWRGWGAPIVIALFVATSITSAIADWNVVPTGSMNPTIVEGDRIFVNKLAYDFKIPYTTWHIATWDDPGRGDIVVFFSPVDGKRLVKRVVGVPGDIITMHGNRLLINGKALTYDAVNDSSLCISGKKQRAAGKCFLENLTENRHLVMLSERPSLYASFRPITIPEGKYFMMGDNRDNSADSRYFGLVERRRIVGRSSSIVASFDINRHYRPRWDRFFTRMQ